MKHYYFTSFCQRLTLLLLVSIISLHWARAQPAFDSSQLLTGTGYYPLTTSVAQGPHGQTYTVLQFEDSVRVGGVTRRILPAQVNSHHAVLLVCFDSLRQVSWTRLISTGFYNTSRHASVRVDGLGNVWVSGLFDDTPNTGLHIEGSSTVWQAAADCNNAWVANFSPAGTLRWATAFIEPISSMPPRLATTQAGNAYVVRERLGRQVGAGPYPPGSMSGSDVDLLKLGPNGQVLARRLDAQHADQGTGGMSYVLTDMTCDPLTERLYLAGINTDTLTLGTLPLTPPQNYVRNPSVAAYAANLSPLWARQYPVQVSNPLIARNQMVASVWGLQAGPQNSLMTIAGYLDRMTVDTARFVNPAPPTGMYGIGHVQVVRLSATGQLQWHTPLGELANLAPVTSSRSDFYYVQALINKPAAIGNYIALPGLPTPTGSFTAEPLLLALTATGTPAWLRQAGADSASHIGPLALDVAPSGAVMLTGMASGTFTWDQASWQPGPRTSWLDVSAFVLWGREHASPSSRLQFLPAAGAPGTTVVLNGRDFQNTTAVRFNGVAATSFRVNPNGDQIVVTVPAGASTGLISLSTPTGLQTTATAFRVSAPLGTHPGAAAAVSIYPNPLPRHGTLSVSSAAVVQQLTVLDALGRVVQQATPQQANPQLVLADVAPGLYSLRIESSAGTVMRRLAVE